MDKSNTIPVSAAEDIAVKYNYDQVVIVARRVGPNGLESVVTFGNNEENSAVAIMIGNILKHKVMGWPEDGTC